MKITRHMTDIEKEEYNICADCAFREVVISPEDGSLCLMCAYDISGVYDFVCGTVTFDWQDTDKCEVRNTDGNCQNFEDKIEE